MLVPVLVRCRFPRQLPSVQDWLRLHAPHDVVEDDIERGMRIFIGVAYAGKDIAVDRQIRRLR